MNERPLSDRKQHQPSDLCWEIRAWAEPQGKVPEAQGWRTLGWSTTHDDAVVLARSVTSSPEASYEFAEVWGPAADPESGRQHTCERFPEPDPDERREMWLRAAATHYWDSVDLPKRTAP